jgi:hypothetical protein
VARKKVDLHAAPADGLQTYKRPYPRFTESEEAGPKLIAGQEVEVGVSRGTWVQLSRGGVFLGWVDGRKLIPPISAPVRMAPVPQSERTPRHVFAISLEAIVGAVASVGIAVGALLDWTQGRHAVSALRVPVQYLFSNRTAAHQPRVGYVLFGIAIVSFVLSFIPRAAIWRVLLGAIVVAIVSAFWMQLAEALSDSNKAIVDVVGAGPWVTGLSGLLLVCSPLFRRRIP